MNLDDVNKKISEHLEGLFGVENEMTDKVAGILYMQRELMLEKFKQQLESGQSENPEVYADIKFHKAYLVLADWNCPVELTGVSFMADSGNMVFDVVGDCKSGQNKLIAAGQLGKEIQIVPLNEIEFPTIKAWLKDNMAHIGMRAFKAIVKNYVKPGEEKSMRELIEDVKTGRILRCRYIGRVTMAEIADMLRSSLKIDL